jgi:hypothetical protein
MSPGYVYCKECYPNDVEVALELQRSSTAAGTASAESCTGGPTTGTTVKTGKVTTLSEMARWTIETDAYHYWRSSGQCMSAQLLASPELLMEELHKKTETAFEGRLWNSWDHSTDSLIPDLRSGTKSLEDLAKLSTVRFMMLSPVDWRRLQNSGTLDHEYTDYGNVSLFYSGRAAVAHWMSRMKALQHWNRTVASTAETKILENGMLASQLTVAALALEKDTLLMYQDCRKLSVFNRLYHEYATALYTAHELTQTEKDYCTGFTLQMTGRELLGMAKDLELIHFCQLFSDGTEHQHNCPRPLWLQRNVLTDDATYGLTPQVPVNEMPRTEPVMQRTGGFLGLFSSLYNRVWRN